MDSIIGKPHVKIGVKIAIALLILFALYRFGSIDYGQMVDFINNPVNLTFSVLCLFLGLALGAVRWWLLLNMSGHRFNFRKALKLYLIGGFFSTYLPGAAGGDLVRAAYVLKIVPKNEGRTTAMLSILIDRLFALLGLIIVGAAASLYIIFHDLHAAGLGPYTSAVLLLVVASPLAVMLTVSIIVILPSTRFLTLIPHRVQAYLQIFRSLSLSYLRQWLALLACTVISTAASAIVVVGMIFIADAFIFAPAPIVTAIAGVFGNIFSAIPITPGGVGVGEAAFSTICEELSGQRGAFATIYLTFRIIMLLANVPGGVLIVRDTLKKKIVGL